MQEKFDEAVTKFIIHFTIFLRTVEVPRFISLFDNFNMSARNITVTSRCTLHYRIHSLFENQKKYIKDK